MTPCRHKYVSQLGDSMIVEWVGVYFSMGDPRPVWKCSQCFQLGRSSYAVNDQILWTNDAITTFVSHDTIVLLFGESSSTGSIK